MEIHAVICLGIPQISILMRIITTMLLKLNISGIGWHLFIDMLMKIINYYVNKSEV
ncbi:hypothetical protein MNBD_GAMMA12-837 [hydrothermal vent metagenome]|uniref:Uncharacterized protein n=1 Tax=hydrothermal vent metagenome TaxID=652676 RepID=A0A3B0ZIY8_9ZZZZ